MYTYQSHRTLPYVYKLVHKTTGQFYYGYQYANRVPSTESLGVCYFTSSKIISKLGFENFNCIVLTEFFDKK